MTRPTLEPCSKRERDLFRDLFAAHERARRDVACAFTAFCAAHGIPEGSELEGVTDVGLMVKRADEPPVGA